MRHYYKILDLPAVPLEFQRCAFNEVVELTSFCMNPINEEHKDRWFIDRTGKPACTWVCINSQCIHSVEGIQTQRIGINISLDHDWFGLDGNTHKETV